MNNLISYINRINISATQDISNVETYTTDIGIIDASHMKYGDIIPIIPKISYETINLKDYGFTSSTINRLHVTADDEIVIFSGDTHYYKYSITGQEFTEEGGVDVTLERHGINHFILGDDNYYYGMGAPRGTVCKYDNDFSAKTSHEVAGLYGEVYPDGSKYYMNGTHVYRYHDAVKSSFLLNGAFVEDVTWLPEDRMYFDGFDIGLESWNNRYIKTLRHDGNVYFLDQLLVPSVNKSALTYSYWETRVQQYNVSIREIDGYIVFARLINKQYLHLTRLELV